MRSRQFRNGLIMCVLLLFFSSNAVFTQIRFQDTNKLFNIDSVISPLQKIKFEIYRDKIARLNRKEFNPYNLSLFWPQPEYEYMPQRLQLFYKQPQYKAIVFKPTVTGRNELKKYQDMMEAKAGEDTLMALFNMEYPLQKIMQRAEIYDPGIVSMEWDEVPEPYSFVDKGYLSTEKAKENVSRILQVRYDYDSKFKIEKLQKIKTPWIYEGIENIQLSQVYLANWVQGGESSISLLSDLRIKAIYKMEKYTWENYAIQKIGLVGQQDSKIRVNDDLFELNSKYGINASEKWYYSGFINFKTQFFNGYESDDKEKENPISAFMSPAYLTFAVGMDFKIPEHKFSLMISPLTSKMTMVLDTVKIDQTRYKVPVGRKVAPLNGGSITNNFSWRINEDFHLNSMMSAFYEYLAKSDVDKEVQFEWEMILDMRINVWLSARLLTHLRYYTNESDRMQFKENLSLAFRYIVRYKR